MINTLTLLTSSAHVTLGAIMLSVILYRAMAGHFTPKRHFAFKPYHGTGTS